MKLNEVINLNEALNDKDNELLQNLIQRMICSDLQCSDSQKEHAVEMLMRTARQSKSKAMKIIKDMVREEHPKSHLFKDDDFETAFDNALADMTGGTEIEWLKESQLNEGYTLKKVRKEKWKKEDWPEPEENDEDGWEEGPTKGWDAEYEIIDNKTKKVVGSAMLGSNDYFGMGKMFGKFHGKSFSFEIDGKDPQAKFNAFTKWPSTKKKYAGII